MLKFFSNYKSIFYTINLFLIFLYIFPGSLLGWVIYGDKKIQPQITSDFLISSNHFYIFIFISILGFLTFRNPREIRILIFYLFSLAISLEIFHLIVPKRSFEWSDFFGNLL